MSKRLIDVINHAINIALNDVHTCLPAKITAVNREQGTISCQPAIARIVNGEAVPLPEFPDVPTITLQGGGAYISLPIEEGDHCLLLVAERCFDKWYEGQNNMAPPSQRKFDYSDCFALIGVNPSTNIIPIPPAGETIITTKSGDYIKLVDGEKIEISTQGNAVVNIAGDASITVDGATKLKCSDVEIGESEFQAVIQSERFKAYFDTHIHTGNLGAPTSPPQVPLPESTFSTEVKTGG